MMHDTMQEERGRPVALILPAPRIGRKRVQTYNDGKGYTKIMQQ